MDELFRGTGVEIDILEPDNFLKIKETLTRIGIASGNTKTLYQSCHILHKRDRSGKSRYAFEHFKEMFKLDGKPSSLELKDVARRNSIVKLLEEWNLLDIIDKNVIDETEDRSKEVMSSIKVLSYKDKDSWELVAKYKIGRK